ncbi:MAG TPA: hypothetical protein DIT25_01225 [Candidatus Moranbacteria bacterium]|nr:hypothetical protein [Candidatus Moranbacteria bacterium]
MEPFQFKEDVTMYDVKVVVEGTGRGLLMHKFSIAASAGLENEVKKAKAVKFTPEVDAEMVAYRLDKVDGQEKGQLCLPAEHFLSSITAAGTSFQKKGQGKKTYKGAFQGSVEVSPDYIGLTNVSGNALMDYEIDSRPVRIKATQGRIIRHRPHIKIWRASFTIQVADDSIPLEVVQAALEEAGKSKCVGDYRPRYGQFRIVSFEQ